MIITMREIKKILAEAEDYCKFKDEKLTDFADGSNHGAHLMALCLENKFNEYQNIQDAAKEGKDADT